MSLINDALKKAQQQRASSPAATTSVPGAQPKKKSLFRIAAVIGLCAVGLSAISVGTTLFILHDDSAAPARAAAKPTVAAQPPPSPAATVPTVTLVPAAPSAAPAVLATPVAPGPKPLSTSLAAPAATPAALVATPSVPTIAFPSASIVPPAIAPAPIQEVKPTVVAAPAPTIRTLDPTQPSPSTQTFIDKLRVAGIRVSDTDSKVILNEHLFRLNEVIEPGLALRLVGIDSHVLTFTDGNGFSYQKRF